ncbi:hypothetical protein SAMN02787079_00567 [Lysinibacillus sp. TC-37]|nr:hypothetical protein SAMN02787078_00568 [Lysinibacillus sp. SG9]SDB07284.1 hypothetical protein SAMN02787079_00567 [Lysinibacillus sp. TC-37]SFS39429.1 hypothetical protein SAMN02787087_00572 [Lysinibacillus sp. SG55]
MSWLAIVGFFLLFIIFITCSIYLLLKNKKEKNVHNNILAFIFLLVGICLLILNLLFLLD